MCQCFILGTYHTIYRWTQVLEESSRNYVHLHMHQTEWEMYTYTIQFQNNDIPDIQMMPTWLQNQRKVTAAGESATEGTSSLQQAECLVDMY